MMSINKGDVHVIVEDHISKHQISLEKNLGLQFNLTNSKIEQVSEKVDKINGRVYKAECNIRELQDLSIKNSTIETYIIESDKRREVLEVKRNRRLLAMVAIMTLLVGFFTLIINYTFFY